MSRFTRRLPSLVSREEGATMVEYGLMVALIALVCIAVVTTVGTLLRDRFTEVQSGLEGAAQ